MKNPTSPMSEISGNKDIRENVVFYHGFIIAIPSSASFTTLACYSTLSSALNKQQQNYNCVAQFFLQTIIFLLKNILSHSFFFKLLKLIIYNLRQLFSGSDLGSAIWTSPILYCKVKVNTK